MAHSGKLDAALSERCLFFFFFLGGGGVNEFLFVLNKWAFEGGFSFLVVSHLFWVCSVLVLRCLFGCCLGWFRCCFIVVSFAKAKGLF